MHPSQNIRSESREIEDFKTQKEISLTTEKDIQLPKMFIWS